MSASPVDGLLVVDKPAEWTSHDVVAKVRALAGTRKVGHAGTLDPMATGVLVLGLGRATRLLGYFSGADKDYLATMRLGQSSSTDDADGDTTATTSAAGVDRAHVEAVASRFVGTVEQVPASVSAIKVSGERAYKLVRRGEDVDLPPRSVHISSLLIGEARRSTAELLDVDFSVTCSSGTYVRALARDIGASLGVGGHLTRLRRTRVGVFDVSQAVTLAALVEHLTLMPLPAAVAAAFPRREVDGATAALVRHGRPLPEAGETSPTGVFGPDGQVLALMAPRDGLLRVVVGLTG